MISKFEIRKVTSYKSNSNLEAGRKLNVQKTFKKTSTRYFERLRHIQFIYFSRAPFGKLMKRRVSLHVKGKAVTR